jgi:hypothetical protein
MAGIADIRDAAKEIVGPICGWQARSFSEADVGRILHAYLRGKFAGVSTECSVNMGTYEGKIDFRFGDPPYGGNKCVVELAVRNTNHGQQLLAVQNKTELKKLSRYPASRAQTRVLLLLDLGHDPLQQERLQRGYRKLNHLGPGKFPRRPVSVVYVHRDLDYRFIWRAK